MKLKLKTFFKRKLSMFTALTVTLAGIPVGSIYASDVSKVQAAGNSVINKKSSVYYDENSSRSNGCATFEYGTVFSSLQELKAYLIDDDSIKDKEDDAAGESHTMDDIILDASTELIGLDNINGFTRFAMSAGMNELNFALEDNGEKTTVVPIPVYIKPIENTDYLTVKTPHKYFLQGTDMTDIYASCADIYDTIAKEYLDYSATEGVQGTYWLKNTGGLDSCKIMNGGRGYSLDEYMSNKDRIDAENTYTVTFGYKGRGSLTATGTASVLITIIPVFPEFSGKTSVQVHQGTTVNISYLKQSDTMQLNAHSALRGDLSGVHTEECSMNFYSVTYPGGVTQYNQSAIDTSALGTVHFVVNATNSFKNSRLSSYNGMVNGTIMVDTPDGGRKTVVIKDTDLSLTVREPGAILIDASDRYVLVGENITKDLITERVVVYSGIDNEYKPTENEQTAIDKHNAEWQKYLDALNYYNNVALPNYNSAYADAQQRQANGEKNVVFPTAPTKPQYTYDDYRKKYEYDSWFFIKEVIEVTLDEYGNEVGEEIRYRNTEEFTENNKLRAETLEGFDTIKTDRERLYKVTFRAENDFYCIGGDYRSDETTIYVRVVDSVVHEPYVRYTKLKYALKTPENLDANGNNIYYDAESVWMNNEEAYKSLIYGLIQTELKKANIIEGDGKYALMVWKFTPEQTKVTKSWTMESGIALDGQDVPKNEVVYGYAFQDSKGTYILHEDAQTDAAVKTYVDPSSVSYGMSPGEALNQKWYTTWYNDCCVIDRTLISHQGNRKYDIIIDTDGAYLFEDDAGNRVKYYGSEEKITHISGSEIKSDTRDYEAYGGIYGYAIKVIVEKYWSEINSKKGEYPDLQYVIKAYNLICH